jgi:hypothetical protein
LTSSLSKDVAARAVFSAGSIASVVVAKEGRKGGTNTMPASTAYFARPLALRPDWLDQ